MTPERSARLRAALNRRQPDLTVITDFVNKQRNLSALVRNCDAVGIMRLHAVLGQEDYRAYRGTAMGSHRWVAVERHASVSQAITGLSAEGYQILAAHPGEAALDYREVDYTRATALLFGAERRGVSPEARDRVDGFITVPMVGMVESYNVSVAAGIVLAEAQHQRRQAGFYDQCRIDDSTYQRLLFEWAYPDLRAYCEARSLAYPPLDSEGELLEPAAWYAAVRAGTAPRAE